MNGLALLVQEGLGRDPFAGDVFVFRGRAGSLIKALWHDGIGLSLYAKRLDRGRFIWPATECGRIDAGIDNNPTILPDLDHHAACLRRTGFRSDRFSRSNDRPHKAALLYAGAHRLGAEGAPPCHQQ